MVRKNIIIENDGNEIKSTNFFLNPSWSRGEIKIDFYLSYNFRILRLLVNFIDSKIKDYFEKAYQIIIKIPVSDFEDVNYHGPAPQISIYLIDKEGKELLSFKGVLEHHIDFDPYQKISARINEVLIYFSENLILTKFKSFKLLINDLRQQEYVRNFVPDNIERINVYNYLPCLTFDLKDMPNDNISNDQILLVREYLIEFMDYDIKDKFVILPKGITFNPQRRLIFKKEEIFPPSKTFDNMDKFYLENILTLKDYFNKFSLLSDQIKNFRP